MPVSGLDCAAKGEQRPGRARHAGGGAGRCIMGVALRRCWDPALRASRDRSFLQPTTDSRVSAIVCERPEDLSDQASQPNQPPP